MISIPFNGIVFDIDMKMLLFISFNTLHTKNEENINKQTIQFPKNKYRTSKESKSSFKNWIRYYETKYKSLFPNSRIHIIFCRIKVWFQQIKKYFI